ncbi:hypothetical protein K469DRAFT_708234 [Zopfia rhizophila CBS 207.26]|uniref:Uncharacterized protein n=1 Tax=Zopfia rhizophila CBS 207.26 TaxID=1314779 RepID=A0A6A6E2N9_9PEZI|nr:hypothetical protein K469DRAFT_708234 [Zopfia rhizophila CBS 207.26]
MQHCLKALRGRSTDGQFGTGRSSRSTGSAGAHLEKNMLAALQAQGVAVPQDVANKMASSFSRNRFLNAVQDWVISNNQALRVIKTPTFQAMIAAANPLVEKALWKNY